MFSRSHAVSELRRQVALPAVALDNDAAEIVRVACAAAPESPPCRRANARIVRWTKETCLFRRFSERFGRRSDIIFKVDRVESLMPLLLRSFDLPDRRNINSYGIVGAERNRGIRGQSEGMPLRHQVVCFAGSKVCGSLVNDSWLGFSHVIVRPGHSRSLGSSIFL